MFTSRRRSVGRVQCCKMLLSTLGNDLRVASVFDLFLLISLAHLFVSNDVFGFCSERTDKKNDTSMLDCSQKGIVLSDNVSNPANYVCSVCHGEETYCVTAETINITLTYYNQSEPVGSRWPTCQHRLTTDQDFLTLIRFNGSNNNITEMPCFGHWSQLEWIDLSNNKIRKLHQPLYFGNLSHLVTLILKNNLLHEIHPEAFIHLSSLQCLYLNDNPALEDWSFLNDSAIKLEVVDIRSTVHVGKDSRGHFLCQCRINTTILVNENATCVYNFSHFGCSSSYSDNFTFPADLSCHVTEGSKVSTTKFEGTTLYLMTTEHVKVDIIEATTLCQAISCHSKKDCIAGLIIIILVTFLGVIIYTFTAICVFSSMSGPSYD